MDEPHTAKGYQSDFDLLIIVNHDKLTDRASYWSKADERLIRERTLTGALRTPVNFIVHTLAEVNDALAQGRYFFADIARDGIALYQSDEIQLVQPRPKTPAEALEIAKEYADDWLPSGRQFLRQYRHAMDDNAPKIAIFDLHQAAERFYHGVLLTLTLYTPHSHRLSLLRSMAEQLDSRMITAWPRETRADRAYFEKLKDAYIKARYSKHFAVSKEDLDWLGARVEALGRIAEEVCAERIASLRGIERSDQSPS